MKHVFNVLYSFIVKYKKHVLFIFLFYFYSYLTGSLWLSHFFLKQVIYVLIWEAESAS